MLKPQPRITALNKPFWEGCNNGKLMIQHCRSCDQHVFYPRACCPYCHADALEWKEASGKGKVMTHTTVRRTHHDGFNDEAPYVFAAVQLDEGPCLYGQMPKAPTEGESLIGRNIRVAFAVHSPSQKIAIFELI